MLYKGVAGAARGVMVSALRTAARVVASALVAVGLVGPTVGCYSYRTSTGPLRVGETTRLDFPQSVPLGSVARTQWKDTTHLPAVSAIEGTLVGVIADSVLLVVRRTFPAESRASRQIVVVPQSPSMRIQQREYSGSRTVLLVVGIAAVVLAFAAYAAAHLEYDTSDSGGGAGY